MEAAAAGRPAEGAALDLLVEQRRLIRWQTASEQAGLALKVITGLVGVAAVALLAGMAWRAAHDRSVVVRAFSTPPAYAARGLTSEVLAGGFMEDLTRIRSRAEGVSLAPTEELRVDGGDIRVEIPQTGVSLGEIERLFERWLGHQTVITGALVEETSGDLTLNARVGGHGWVSVSGPPEQRAELIRRLAEKSFAAYRPDQWVVYLRAENRHDEALAAAKANLIANPARDWTLGRDYSLWGGREGDPARQVRLFQKAVALGPKQMPFRRNLAGAYERLGDEQAALESAKIVLTLRVEDQTTVFTRPDVVAAKLRQDARRIVAKLSGAYADARTLAQTDAEQSLAAAQGHDGAGARQVVADAVEVEKITPAAAAFTQVHIAEAAGDWAAMAAAMSDYERAREAAFNTPPAQGLPAPAGSPVGQAQYAALRARRDGPLLARALARSGEIARARAAAAATPLDCAPCLRARGEVEAAARNWAGADAWYARAAAFAPRLPQAQTLWGESLLARGDAAGAIAKLSVAAAKGPRYADPLELWGEALMRQGKMAPATAKFAQAAKFAPRWGRLHLRWGEALAAQGKADQARAEWRAAARMDLSPSDRARLNQLLAARS